MAHMTPTPVLDPSDDKTMILNMGPQHPSTHGVLRLLLEIDGETIVRVMPDIGYLHTGIEKTCEAKFYQQVVPMTDRIDYLCPMTNNLAYCLAVEKLLGLEIPPRAQWIRVMLNELTRINSHLVWLGTHALDIGAMTVFLYCFREREDVLRLFEAVSGQRMMTSYFRIGGTRAGAAAGLLRSREEFSRSLSREHRRIREPADQQSHLGEAHQRRGLPRARRCDRALCNRPNAARQRRGCRPPARSARTADTRSSSSTCRSRTDGDVYARYLIRVAELRESQKIAMQALEGIPEGPVKADAPHVVLPDREKMKTQMEALIYHFKIVTEGFTVPAGEVYMPIESPRGEMGYYVVSDGTAKPYRVHMRSPSFANLQSLRKMCEGNLIADVVAAIGSIDIVLGDCDR